MTGRYAMQQRLKGTVDRAIDRLTPKRVRQFPLETLLAFWSPVSALSVILGDPPAALRALPEGILIWWAVMSSFAGMLIGVGLVLGRYGTIMANGMYVLSAVVISFGIGALANATTNSVVGPSFLLLVGVHFWIRGWELRREEETVARILELNGSDHG